tara:strand:- start:10130 stop:12493 length:2364 start_codon:yes stop_codon:yes gene_type:complete
MQEGVRKSMKRLTASILTIVLFSSLFSSVPVYADDHTEQELFTLSGNVFAKDGNLADSTSIKVDSMPSIWSENGNYVFSGISPGEHTVRAYFMNNGHTVSYRKMIFDSDMELDWHVGENWITVEMFDEEGNHIPDSSSSYVELIELNNINYFNNGRTEFGTFDIGEYFTIRGVYDNDNYPTQYVHFKLSGSSPNDFDLNEGMNSRYGYVVDDSGIPIKGVLVSNGEKSAVTNADGFYLLQNLPIGSNQSFSATLEGISIMDPVASVISGGEGWMNLSSNVNLEFPENVSFITQLQVIPMSSLSIDWEGGDYTDLFSLYSNGELVYRGSSTTFDFNPTEVGTYEFTIEAANNNGTNLNPTSLMIIVLPDDNADTLWSAGMSWDYGVSYTPESVNGIHNVTLTAIGSEISIDSFGRERNTFLTRYNNEYYEEGEQSYRWIDSENLLNVHTYWVDSPSSSSYFQEGTLGWNFTNNLGQSVGLLESEDDINLHFNRTNVIGVPGHPNGYDDTMNSVEINQDVPITTAAGTFLTKHIVITDNLDGIVSWELWYNESVRNWVKIIDQLPGSHSEKVVYELQSFEVPMNPQFLTEEANISTNEYTVEWANFQGTDSYQLFENDVLVYQGKENSYLIQNQTDGNHRYQINSIMPSGHTVIGETISLDIFHIVEPPLILNSFTSEYNEGKDITFSWTPVKNAAWYSLTVENADGFTIEMYNGTDNYTSSDELDIGQNRIRIQVGLSNGKVSDFSDSVFVSVNEKSNSDFLNIENMLIFMVSLLTIVTIYAYINRED